MKRRILVLLGLALLTVIVPLICCFIGDYRITPQDIFGTGNDSARAVFFDIRLPRILVGLLAGAGLGLCGMTFQALFRNPLTTPYTLGVAGGASLGAVIFIGLGLSFSIVGISGISIFAFLGAGAAIFLVHGLSRMRYGVSTNTLLLAGVALSFCFSSLILFLQFRSSYHDSYRIVRWMMGGLQVLGLQPLLNVAPFVLGGALLIALHTHELNLLSTGEELATSRGVDAKRTKTLLFLAASFTVGGIVAVCGPIGFVGLMAPHICRMMIGPDHRYLGPATAMFGGTFLVVCDTIARVILHSSEIPVGVITALLGGPYFLLLLCVGNRHRLS